MALIACPECGRQVSERAAACPGCGVAIANADEYRAAGAQLTTIQETSKRFKVHTLISLGMIFLGIILLYGGMSGQAGGEIGSIQAIVAPLMIVGGFGYLIVTRFRVWWHHK